MTGVGRPAGNSLARQLMDRGHWVLGVDAHPVEASVAHAVSVVSQPHVPGYLWELRGLAAIHDIEVVVPTARDELLVVSAAKNHFAPGVDVLIADPAPLRVVHDKYLAMQRLVAAGIPVVGFGLPGEFGSINEAMVQLGGTLVVRPRVSKGGLGARVLKRRSIAGHAAVNWSALDDSWMVQRFTPGPAYLPTVLRHALSGGVADVVVVLEKTGQVGSRGIRRAYRDSIRRVDLPDVARLAGAAAAASQLSGPVGLAIRRRPDGSPVVLGIEAGFGAHSAWAPELVDGVMRPYATEGSRMAR
ncbi:hypothetical protein SB659_10030 [Arthrobacter sp. SIMBA_036]|uniref:hypothetical protein n=1 Tax=Arthrobacter sp. SIMBA_036 TaxID=3085778 RepID=UPI00397909EF